MRNLFFLLIVLFIAACKETPTEYKVHSPEISYKYIQLGSEGTLKESEVLEVRLMVLSETKDTLHYVHNYHYFLEPGVNALDTVFRVFHVGDSVELKVNRALINNYFKFYKVLQSNEGKVHVAIKIVNAYDSEEAKMAKLEFASKREIQEQLELKKYLSSLTGKVDTLNGVYYQILATSDSSNNSIEFGSEVSIHYKGYFSDGFVFDNTYQKSIAPTFTFGREYQMIEGFQTALSGRKEGERVKIILPSRHAFGEEGSLAGIVPPYTAVIYDVNIIKVIN